MSTYDDITLQGCENIRNSRKCFLCFAECSVEHPCEGLSKHAHFRNFGMAFLTLFRVATGDNWNGIMKVSIFSFKSLELEI